MKKDVSVKFDSLDKEEQDLVKAGVKAFAGLAFLFTMGTLVFYGTLIFLVAAAIKWIVG